VDIVLRAAFLFAFIFLLTRIVGRRELASLEPFDIILLVVTGDLIQQGVTQSDNSVTGAVLAVTTMAVLTVAVSYVSFRSRRARRILEGEPILLVDDGRVLEANLRRERITVGELYEAFRENNVESLSDVRWAVLENGGQISIVPRSG
jgi:uncharacterized membrane protein YcaP (DUF421 family)